MCGIVGYIGAQDATDIIVEGLRKLEYRGYDSAGVAVLKTDERIFAAPSASFATSTGRSSSGR